MSDPGSGGGERISRRRYLIERTYALALQDGYPVNEFSVAEAVSSTALAHPEWDLDAVATRDEWREHEGRR